MARFALLSWKVLLVLLVLAGTQRLAFAQVVFVADDGGGQQDFRTLFSQCVREARLPLQVVAVNWSNETYAKENANREHQLAEGRKLAARVMATHKTRPGAPIYLMGFGIGSAIVLHAAECLPYHSVARIVVVAAAVSDTYDLRPALFASCEGIDSFSSNYDTILAHNIKWHGSADGVRRSGAGLSGFKPQVECHQDAFLYSRLRQHRLEPLDPHTNAGHVGYFQARFIHGHILPVYRRALAYPGR